MSKRTVDDGSFISLQAFMVNDLHLSGNELIVYAVIYGFSQDGMSWFTGSRSYLATWCQTSEKSVTNNLHKLLNKKLIEKRVRSEGSQTFNDYRAIRAASGGKKVPTPREASSLGRGEESSPHTIGVDTIVEKDIVPCEEIIRYLNERTGRNYDPQGDSNKKLIAARWRERQRTVDDFKRVIDNMASRWLGDAKMEQYLRPSTLFSKAHFDEYLNTTPSRSNRKVEYDYSAYDAAFYGA